MTPWAMFVAQAARTQCAVSVNRCARTIKFRAPCGEHDDDEEFADVKDGRTCYGCARYLPTMMFGLAGKHKNGAIKYDSYCRPCRCVLQREKRATIRAARHAKK